MLMSAPIPKQVALLTQNAIYRDIRFNGQLATKSNDRRTKDLDTLEWYLKRDGVLAVRSFLFLWLSRHRNDMLILTMPTEEQLNDFSRKVFDGKRANLHMLAIIAYPSGNPSLYGSFDIEFDPEASDVHWFVSVNT